MRNHLCCSTLVLLAVDYITCMCFKVCKCVCSSADSDCCIFQMFGCGRTAVVQCQWGEGCVCLQCPPGQEPSKVGTLLHLQLEYFEKLMETSVFHIQRLRLLAILKPQAYFDLKHPIIAPVVCLVGCNRQNVDLGSAKNTMFFPGLPFILHHTVFHKYWTCSY